MSTPQDLAAVVAAADLGKRAGAKTFEIMWECPHTPDEEYGHNCEDITWHATAMYNGTRLAAEGPTAEAAALAFAARILEGGRCRCGRKAAVLAPFDSDSCLWRLEGDRWEPECDAPPIAMAAGQRGDLASMMDTFTRAAGRLGAPINRETRRAMKHAKRKKGK